MSEYLLVLKAAAPVASKLGSLGWRALTIHWQVARKANASAASDGYGFSIKVLRKTLRTRAILAALKRQDPIALEHAARSLRSAVLASSAIPADGLLLSYVLDGYIRSLPAGDGMALLGRSIVEEIKAQIRAEEEFDATDDLVAFERNLQTLPMARRESMAKLSEQFPEVRLIARDLAAAPDVAKQLESWSTTPPGWLSSDSGEMACLLGGLSDDYGALQAADLFYERGIHLGASPRGYWSAIRVMVQVRLGIIQAGDVPDAVDEHPLGLALVANAHDGADQARELLSDWEASRPEEAWTRLTLLARFALAQRDWDAAMRFARQGWDAAQLTGAALVGIQAQLTRATLSTRDPAMDTEEALGWALEVCDARRQSRRPASDAIVLASKCAIVRGDFDLAWRLVRPQPEGTASVEEARDRGVLIIAATIAARSGNIQFAESALSQIDSKAQRLALRAELAERGDDEARVVALLEEAYANAEDFDTRRDLAFRLAMYGRTTSFLSELRSISDAYADQLEMMIGLFSDDPVALARAKAESLRERNAAALLIVYYGRRKQGQDVERVAVNAAEQWHDADFWLTASRESARAKRFADADKYARQALAVSSPRWPGRPSAYVGLIEINSRTTNWDAAEEAARNLYMERPDRGDALWALIGTRIHAGLFEEALDAFARVGERPSPRQAQEFRYVLELYRRFGHRAATPSWLIAEVKPWDSDETVRAALATILMVPEFRDDEISDVDAEAISVEVQRFFLDFPESKLLRQFTVDTENAVDSILSVVGELPDTSDHDKAVGQGSLPLGSSTEVHGVGYLEALVGGTAGPFFLRRGHSPVAPVAVVPESTVVADTSALLTLSRMPGASREAIRGYFGQVLTSARQSLDARLSAEALARRSGFSFRRSRVDGDLEPYEVPADTLEGVRLTAAQCAAEFEFTLKRSISPEESQDELPGVGQKAPWLDAVRYARLHKEVLWCDDAALRGLASELGVATIASDDVLFSLVREGRLSEADSRAAVRQLIRSGVTSDRWLIDDVREAAKAQRWRPSGVSHVLAHLPVDVPALEALGLVGQALQTRDLSDMEVGQWGYGLGRWLVDVAGDPAPAMQNIALALANLTSRPLANPHHAGPLLTGFRAALADRGVEGDPLPLSVDKSLDQLEGGLDAATASAVVFARFGGLKGPDRVSVTERVLGRR